MRCLRKLSVILAMIATLAVGCSNTIDGEVGSIELSPRNVLLAGQGDSWPLTAVVHAPDGSVIDADITWEIDDPAVISVEDGVATALVDAGSTYVRAVVGEVRSNDAFVYSAILQAGAVLVADADIVSEVEPLVADPVVLPVTRFRVELDSGVTPPAVGAPIVAREEAPILGRVASVSGSTVEYEAVPLAEVFAELEVRTDDPLVDATPYEPGRAVEALEFTVGGVECELDSDTLAPDISVTEQSLDLSRLRLVRYVSITGSESVAVSTRLQGDIDGHIVTEITLPDPVEGEIRCEYGFPPIIIPVTGPLSPLLSPFVESGVGVHLNATIRGARLGYEVTLDVATADPVDIGFDWSNAAGYQSYDQFELSSDSSVRLLTPDLTDVEVAESLYTYAFANLKFGIPKKPDYAIEFIVFRSGLRHTADVRLVQNAQLDDLSYRSRYGTEYLFQIAPGSAAEWVFDLLGVEEPDATLDLPLPLATSPTGTLAVTTPILPGEDAMPTVTFTNDTYGLVPNIREVALYREGPDGWELVASTGGTAGQLVYPFSWVAGDGEVGEHRFAAMVLTNFVPTLWMEIANDSTQRVTVEGDVAPFEIIELYDPLWAPHTFSDVNDSGQILGREPTNPLAVLLTPTAAAAPGEAPRWYVDEDDDGRNDLAAEISSIDNGRGPGTHSRPTVLNNLGQVAGRSDVRTRWGGDDPYAAYWATLDAPVDQRLQLIGHIGDVDIPMSSLNYAMFPLARDVVAMNDSGATLINVSGTSVILQDGVASFIGGPPTCMGCIPGRIGVGVIVYAAVGTGADLNDSGQVCGVGRDATDAWRPARWVGGAMPIFLEDLGVSIATPSASIGPLAINNSGTIVGALPAMAAGELRAVVWEGTSPRDLGTFGGASATALDVDDMGAIIGWAENAEGELRPFLYLPATRWGVGAGMHDLADLVDGVLLPGELPTRMSNTGLILTSEGRLLRAAGS